MQIDIVNPNSISMTTTEFNKDRLDYLLALFGMSNDELLSILNEGRKKLFTLDELNGDTIQMSLLKKIDEIFKKGLSFYMDFSPIAISHSSKVLFRKKHFQADLSIEDKRIVDSFESLKVLLDGYRLLSDTASSEQPLKGSATISQSPQKVADKVRSCLLPDKQIKDHKEFLKGIIKKLARLNVYVFEFVETWNKREKASIDGFYISPNVIVLKRQQSYKREIFTLAHEIGHYLLGKEEIDSLDMAKVEERRMHNLEERWCNDFAFFLIAGDAVTELDKFDSYSEDVNMMIDHLSSTTHISRMAWYTRLAYDKKVPVKYYHAIIRQIEEETEERKIKEKEDKKKESGMARSPKPIISPLYMETMQHAFFNGLVSEAVFVKKLGIPKNQIDKYLC